MLVLNGVQIDFGLFPNKESFADLPVGLIRSEGNVIHMRFDSDEDLLRLVFLKHAVDDVAGCGSDTVLFCPYFPYSRMDRAENQRLFTLRSVAWLINSLEFDTVWVLEPHSSVLYSLVHNLRVFTLGEGLSELIVRAAHHWCTAVGFGCEVSEEVFEAAGVYFVYPDAGAEQRYGTQYSYPNVITCSKRRDFDTGRILGIEAHVSQEAVEKCRCAIIVDDLCAKGGTFIGAAQALRKALPNLERVCLCVSHCEFTVLKGSVFTSGDVDRVYTTDSILNSAGFQDEPEGYVSRALLDGRMFFHKLLIPTDTSDFEGVVSIESAGL